ncbi:signal peptidase I [Patescibacteria group bacterium]|nr:signal peptidase I [Patescibacteria group bacterium]
MNSKDTPKKKSLKKEILELLRFVLIVLAVVIPIRIFVAQPFIVNGESMVPTLANGDYLIIDEVSYRTGDPERGDVVVFRDPTKHNRFLIKRIIGLPGETIEINGSRVTIMDSGELIQLNEDYLNGNFSSYGTWKLGENEYFAMGDNRQRSLDSRSWGVLPGDLIVGKTFLRLFPLAHFAFHPGEVSAQEIETLIEV